MCDRFNWTLAEVRSMAPIDYLQFLTMMDVEVKVQELRKKGRQ